MNKTNVFKLIQTVIYSSALIFSTASFAETEEESFTVNRHVSASNAAYNANSYWLESSSGIALIDAQLFRSDAKRLALAIINTGKPLMGVIVTHPHADHYGGLNMLREELGYFPVYATAATAAAIPANHALNSSYGFGLDFDSTFIEPDNLVNSGDTINIAGISLKIDDLGSGEAVDNAVIYHVGKNVLFTGDSTQHNQHYYLGDGFSKGALSQLRHIKDNYGNAAQLYPGHGDSATPAMVIRPEMRYIKLTRSLVKRALRRGNIQNTDGTFKPEKVQRIVRRIIRAYPSLGDYGLTPEGIVTFNVNGVLTEMTQ